MATSYRLRMIDLPFTENEDKNTAQGVAWAREAL